MWGDQVDFVREGMRHLDRMQAGLGPLSDETRQIRYHIGTLLPCDSGIPPAIDELLFAIGTGALPEPSFHNGCTVCGWWWQTRTTQPRQMESMAVIRDTLTDYLDGVAEEEVIEKRPYAAGFVRRTYQWFGPRSGFSDLQVLMVQRMLLVFGFSTQTTMTCAGVNGALWESTNRQLHDRGGRGEEIDREIARLAGLPMLYPEFSPEYQATVDSIQDESKRRLYAICGAIAHGLHGSCDCHHSAFRWIENWIHAIGTGEWTVPTRKKGTERDRLGALFAGYSIALDKWLLGVPMQFLLLDLGHLDLGFDPKNEILRVYAHLGDERDPTKEWLAGCLWSQIYRHAIRFEQMARARPLGVRAGEWMSHALRKRT
jgi:hypothetical protein